MVPGVKLPDMRSDNHYHQFVDAVRGVGATSAPFAYSGPLTEKVLLGDLKWDTKTLSVTNVADANAFVRRTPRKG